MERERWNTILLGATFVLALLALSQTQLNNEHLDHLEQRYDDLDSQVERNTVASAFHLYCGAKGQRLAECFSNLNVTSEGIGNQTSMAVFLGEAEFFQNDKTEGDS